MPPFSGFWSKDKIIEAAFVGEGWRPWVFGGVALLGAGITAFYMSRLFFMTFHGRAALAEGRAHPHESPLLMTVPMIVLAVGSVGLGAAARRSATASRIWLEPVTGRTREHDEPVLPVPVITVAHARARGRSACVLAWRQYWAADGARSRAARHRSLTRAARADLYQDDGERGAARCGPGST